MLLELVLLIIILVQIKLTTTNGFIPANTGSSFSFNNPGYNNYSSLGIALCGYDLPPQQQMQFKSDLSFNSGSNTFIILLLPSNGTSFYTLTYFLLIANAPAASYLYVQETCIFLLIIGIVPAYDPTNQYYKNRNYTFSVGSPLNRNTTSTLTAIPFLRSLMAVSRGSYNYYNITGMTVTNINGRITVFLNYSIVT